MNRKEKDNFPKACQEWVLKEKDERPPPLNPDFSTQIEVGSCRRPWCICIYGQPFKNGTELKNVKNGKCILVGKKCQQVIFQTGLAVNYQHNVVTYEYFRGRK
jgi:hypothetical protein